MLSKCFGGETLCLRKVWVGVLGNVPLAGSLCHSPHCPQVLHAAEVLGANL